MRGERFGGLPSRRASARSESRQQKSHRMDARNLHRRACRLLARRLRASRAAIELAMQSA
jgi:hypothetical protein